MIIDSEFVEKLEDRYVWVAICTEENGDEYDVYNDLDEQETVHVLRA